MKFNTALSVAGAILLNIAGSLCQLDVCGQAPLNTKIVGGGDATAGAWPWQVSIRIACDGNLCYCGGSLITKDWVLSAAHCFEGASASDVVMYIGRQSQSGLNSNEINRTARGIIIHQNYNDTQFNNDIALVQLSSSVMFTDYIKPVCLAAAGSKFAGGTESWVTGWGTLQSGGQLADILQEVMIPVVSNSNCNKAYGAGITSNMICDGSSVTLCGKEQAFSALEGVYCALCLSLARDKHALIPAAFYTELHELCMEDLATVSDSGTTGHYRVSSREVSSRDAPDIPGGMHHILLIPRPEGLLWLCYPPIPHALGCFCGNPFFLVLALEQQPNDLTPPRCWISFYTPSSGYSSQDKKSMRMMLRLAVCVAGVLLLNITGSLGQLNVCGRAPLKPKIVGGQNAVKGSWPWQASINYIPNGDLVCGGSLINKDWVLSAVQCFQELNTSTTVIYLGRHQQIGANPHEISRRVDQIVIHPEYNPKNFDNDIALVKLSSSVTFNEYISPVCLAATGSTFAEGTESWITGWGELNFGSNLFPAILQEVKVPVVSNTYCKSVYGSAFRDSMMCAGPTEGGKGACIGDGGGALVIKDSQWIQSGILIFTVNCTAPKYPGGYTRVSEYQSWISSVIGSNLPGFLKSSGFRSLPLFSLSLTFSIFPLIFSLYLFF
ncbi:uncharacterized protein LOC127158567 [Labeo rohita]|uniref:uncharacterized protein LOC127158567 n=1 Tax=Labeo rohita TaxID=84645 RepID=UPI0021E2CFCA|nr:uncharacterized protein LOC127158567 [Labeo rohita]